MALESHLRQRTSKVNTFLKKNKCDENTGPTKLQKTFVSLKKKESEAQTRLNKKVKKLQEKLKDEEEWRSELVEVFQFD